MNTLVKLARLGAGSSSGIAIDVSKRSVAENGAGIAPGIPSWLVPCSVSSMSVAVAGDVRQSVHRVRTILQVARIVLLP